MEPLCLRSTCFSHRRPDQLGELDSLRESIKMMGTIEAELNRLSLATMTYLSTKRVESKTCLKKSIQSIMKSLSKSWWVPLAKEDGVTYLEKGTHTFTLNNGTKFTVYASPYIGSGGWAFPYKPFADRFNDADQSGPNRTSIATNPIPSGVDIVMTHGPPHSILDQVDNQNLGCPNLLRAISRVRPLMHCFGHIHEGHGANIVTLKPDGSVKDPSSATPLETEQINKYPYANEWHIKSGKQTLHGQRGHYGEYRKRNAAGL